MHGRLERVVTNIEVRQVHGQVDLENGEVKWSNGMAGHYKAGTISHHLEGTTVWDRDPDHVCRDTTSNVYLGTALMYIPKYSGPERITILRPSLDPINIKLGRKDNNLCHQGCHTTQIKRTLLCLLGDQREPIHQGQLKFKKPNGVLDIHGRIDYSLLTDHFTETSQLTRLNGILTRRSREIPSPTVATCRMREALPGTTTNCTQSIPIRFIGDPITRFADPISWRVRNSTHIVPCPRAGRPTWGMNGRWFCTNTTSHQLLAACQWTKDTNEGGRSWPNRAEPLLKVHTSSSKTAASHGSRLRGTWLLLPVATMITASSHLTTQFWQYSLYGAVLTSIAAADPCISNDSPIIDGITTTWMALLNICLLCYLAKAAHKAITEYRAGRAARQAARCSIFYTSPLTTPNYHDAHTTNANTEFWHAGSMDKARCSSPEDNYDKVDYPELEHHTAKVEAFYRIPENNTLASPYRKLTRFAHYNAPDQVVPHFRTSPKIYRFTDTDEHASSPRSLIRTARCPPGRAPTTNYHPRRNANYSDSNAASLSTVSGKDNSDAYVLMQKRAGLCFSPRRPRRSQTNCLEEENIYETFNHA
jgi:hypothetical protein